MRKSDGARIDLIDLLDLLDLIDGRDFTDLELALSPGVVGALLDAIEVGLHVR